MGINISGSKLDNLVPLYSIGWVIDVKAWLFLLTKLYNLILKFTNCRGYKFNFGGGNVTRFPDRMLLMEQQSGGRVIARFPLGHGDDWFDGLGHRHAAPVPPANLQHLRLPFEVQLNSSRMFVTAHRGPIERSFGKGDWAKSSLGSRSQIPHQYLANWGFQPTPQVPFIYVLLMVDMAIEVRILLYKTEKSLNFKSSLSHFSFS